MKALDLVERDTALLVLALAVASWVAGLGNAISVLLGGGFMVINFRVIRMLVGRAVSSSRRALGSESAAGRRTWPLFIGKLLLGIALIAGVLYQFPVEPLSFAAGTTALLLVIVLRGISGGLADEAGTSESSPTEN
ncbi:MAG: hypothetical protein HRT46_00410 [Deltaproteobacteria bacterium]|nr:hypothetical protein [Deltaproteobacteria bacterium]